jgi:hypothetical protein
MEFPPHSGGGSLGLQCSITLFRALAARDKFGVDVEVVEDFPRPAEVGELADDQSQRWVFGAIRPVLVAGVDRLDQSSGDTTRVAPTLLDLQCVFDTVLRHGGHHVAHQSRR